MTRRTRSHLLTFASALLAASLSHGHARAQTAQGQARVGAFDDYMLKDEEYERDAFRGFAEVLKADEQLNVCVVVRPSIPSEETFNPDFPRDHDGPPDVDLVALAEKWKARLSKEYRIGAHRMTVMVVQPENEIRAGEIETWVLPAGAPLPNPSAEEAEGVGGEGGQERGKL